MSDIKLAINSDKIDLVNCPIQRTIVKMGIYEPDLENADYVLNIDSIHHVGMKKGKKLTIYWELDDYMTAGNNKPLYDQADLLYIVHPEYRMFYPTKTKILPVAADPDFHKEHPVQKLCDYIFVGSMEFLEVYFNRIITLDRCLRSGADMFITYGTKTKYPYLMSLGRVILDVIPKHASGRVCMHAKIYEAMATGCLMVDYHPYMDRIATLNVHYLSFDKFGKATVEEIERIKKASRELIISRHTWKHRINRIISDIHDLL